MERTYVGDHLGTVGEDGLLRIWQEDVSEPPNSGRRFKKIAEQISETAVPYMSLDFKNIGTETYLATTTRDGYVTVCEPEDHDDLRSWRIMWSEYLCKTPSRTEETSFRVSWHKEKLPAWPAVLAGLDKKSLSLAVSVGMSVKIFRTDKERRFFTAATLEGAKDLVRDVSWASGSMRGFDTIATASKDGFVRIYELHTPGATSLPTTDTPGLNGHSTTTKPSYAVELPTRSGIGAGLAGGTRGRRDDAAGGPGIVKQDVRMVAELESHSGSPWRVSWSEIGDILISTGDDGTARMWKKSVEGKWLEAAEIDATIDK